MNRAEPPDAHQRGEILAALAHQRCDAVARPHAKLVERGGEALGIAFELAVGQLIDAAVRVQNTIGQHPPRVPVT